MKTHTITTKTLLILGCLLTLLACETRGGSSTEGTPDPTTAAEPSPNFNTNEDPVTNIPADYTVENCNDFNFTPCGGEIVGTWNPTSTCLLAPEGLSLVETAYNDPDCPTQEIGVRVASTIAALTFGEDDTYTLMGLGSINLALWRPSTCDQGDTCAEIQQAMNSEGSGQESDTASDAPDAAPAADDAASADEGDSENSMVWACTTSADGCLCESVYNQSPVEETGTYTTENNTVTMTPSSEETPADPTNADADGAAADDESDTDGEYSGPHSFNYCGDGTSLQLNAVSPPDEAMELYINLAKQ